MHFHSCKKSIALLMILMLMFNFALIFSGNFLCSAVSGEGDIITVDDDGNKDYTSIQDAIDAANAGDIIHIYPGLYRENIVVDKPLVLMGVPGEDLPVIAPAESADTTMTLTADGCTLDGLKVNGCEGYLKAAIKIISNNNLLQNNAKSLNDIQMQMKCEYGGQYSHIVEHDININKAANMQIPTFYQQKIQLL